MNIINARLRGKPGLFRIELSGERIAAIVPQAEGVRRALPMTWMPGRTWWWRPLSNRTSTWTPR